MSNTVFYILFALWVMAIGIWVYTIINRKARENFAYIYPLIAMWILNVLMLIIAKLN